MNTLAKATIHDKTIDVVGADGRVTTLIQRADGGLEIHTEAMAKSGHAVHVEPPRPDSNGTAQVKSIKICY